MLSHEDYAGHAEQPLRISSIYDHLKSKGLLDQMMQLDIVESEVKVRDDGSVEYPALEKVKDPKDIKRIEKVVEKLEEKENKTIENDSLFYCKETLNAAKLSADSALTAVCEVLDNESPRNRGFCIVRPPGHHAHEKFHHGFCFFNNVALAAELAASQGKKVLIFDWDIHQGDGTQTIFYESN